MDIDRVGDVEDLVGDIENDIDNSYIITHPISLVPSDNNTLWDRVDVNVNIKKLSIDKLVLTDVECPDEEEMAFIISHATIVPNATYTRSGIDKSYYYVYDRSTLRDGEQNQTVVSKAFIFFLENFVKIDVYGTYQVKKGGNYIFFRDGKFHYAELSANDAVDLGVGDMYLCLAADIIGYNFGLAVDTKGNIVFNNPFSVVEEEQGSASVIGSIGGEQIKKVTALAKVGHVCYKIWNWIKPKKSQSQLLEEELHKIEDDELD